jgi:hypothetical protein
VALVKFFFYVARWQLSTPILWLVVSRLGTGLEATIIANLIGASIFYWMDRFIFRAGSAVIWEVMSAGVCCDCGVFTSVRRLVLAPGGRRSKAGVYDRRRDLQPQYRCEPCSKAKLDELKAREAVAVQGLLLA